MAKTPKLTEKQIQEQVIELLRLCGVWCWLSHKVGAFRHRNVKKGVSDILGIWPPGSGRLLAIEVKKPGGKLTFEQQEFLEDVNRGGGTGIMVDDIGTMVERLGLKVRF
jgi:VRR-NUC domain